MKLNNFLEETPIVKPKRVTFNLENEAKDTQYQKEITELEDKLEHYASLEDSFEQLKRSNSKLHESHIDSNALLSKAEEKASILNLDLTQAQEKIDLIPEFEETVRGLNGSLSDKSNELDNMQKVAHQQSSDLMALRRQVEGLQNENKQLLEQTEESVSHSISAENELESIKSTFGTLESNMHVFGQENTKFRREVSELRDAASFWQTEASEASIRIEQLEELESRLRNWISDCEVSISKSEAKSGGASKDNEGLTQTVAEMGGTINDLMQELTFVNSLNTEYRKEIAKPRYASVGAIASKEGFAMPLAKENIRIKNLGNSSPTLLKFREKESI
jgi:chromosome segregation ATPase